MTKIYAVANQKGGVGKTTTVINLCGYLAHSGRRVLLVDMDPQANATSGIGYDKYQMSPSTYELLLEENNFAEVRRRRDDYQLDALPAHPALAGAEVEIINAIGREFRLHNALQAQLSNYDYILIDCPPSLSMLTVNALTAATDGIIIPVQCEYLALEGLTQLTHTVELVRQYLNPKLQIRGLVMTMYDTRTNLSRQVVEEVRKYFPGKVFRTIVPRNVRLSEAPSYGQPIHVYAPTSPGGIAYKVLAAELVKGDNSSTSGGAA